MTVDGVTSDHRPIPATSKRRKITKPEKVSLHWIIDLTGDDVIIKPALSNNKDEVFRVYCKGLVSDEKVMNVKMRFGGIGVVICDARDLHVFEVKKGFLVEAGVSGEVEGEVVEVKGLVEGLENAVSLGMKRVCVYSDSEFVYQCLTGKGKPTNDKISTLVDQLDLIQKKFTSCSPLLVSQKNVKAAYKLARKAIGSEASKWEEKDSSGCTFIEQCKICFECFDSGQMFSVNECLHRYCFSCMEKHVEAMLLQGKLPKCPHDKCKSELETESCKMFLTPELYDMMSLRIKEATIPPSERVYCPFSNCSALMSKSEVLDNTKTSSSTDSMSETAVQQNTTTSLPTHIFPIVGKNTSSSTDAQDPGMRKCVKCHRRFCINCKVPWHDKIACSDYMKSFLFKSSDEGKLMSLATKNRWRECIKCKTLVELIIGCYHISCRCGYEFCYTCGAEWIKKKSTCKCPIWDERNIIYPQQNRR